MCNSLPNIAKELFVHGIIIVEAPLVEFGERKVENFQHLGYLCFGDLKEPNYLNVLNNFRNILFAKKWK